MPTKVIQTTAKMAIITTPLVQLYNVIKELIIYIIYFVLDVKIETLRIMKYDFYQLRQIN